ncbi:MAG: hypothetical protein AB8B87_19930 [Granulosicoccus sp.]
MSQFQIFFLPLVALSLIIFFPLFDRDVPLSNSWRSSRRRRIMLGRVTVVVLLLATLIAYIWPISSLNSIVHSTIVASAMMVPVLLVYWLVSARLGTERVTMAVRNNNETQTAGYQAEKTAVAAPIDVSAPVIARNPMSEPPVLRNTVPESRPVSSSRVKQHGSRPQQQQGVPERQEQQARPRQAQPQQAVPDRQAQQAQSQQTQQRRAVPPAQPKQKDQAPEPHLDRPVFNFVTPIEPAKDTDRDVQEHMDRVSELVQSHDLDEPFFASPETEEFIEQNREFRDRQVADNTAMVASPFQSDDLTKLTTTQISDLVATLRKDKGRLQKLVIAQQASIESERHAHDQTRVLTRDAIKIMRNARTAQKQAEKLARRERTERKRLEQEYKKVSSALRNAMSIVEKRKSEDATKSVKTPGDVADVAYL